MTDALTSISLMSPCHRQTIPAHDPKVRLVVRGDSVDQWSVCTIRFGKVRGGDSRPGLAIGVCAEVRWDVLSFHLHCFVRIGWPSVKEHAGKVWFIEGWFGPEVWQEECDRPLKFWVFRKRVQH